MADSSAGAFKVTFGDMSLAPNNLEQWINPFLVMGNQFSLFKIDLGKSGNEQLERKILDEVGSYGRQIGHIGEVVEVLMDLVDEKDLSPEGKKAFKALRRDLDRVCELKEKAE